MIQETAGSFSDLVNWGIGGAVIVTVVIFIAYLREGRKLEREERAATEAARAKEREDFTAALRLVTEGASAERREQTKVMQDMHSELKAHTESLRRLEGRSAKPAT